MDLYDDPNKGNTEAYARLYDENATALFRLAGAIVWNRQEAEEIVQEAFLRLHETVREGHIRSVEGYLRSTVKNLAIDCLRRRKTRFGFVRENQRISKTSSETPFEWSEKQEIEKRFLAMLGELPDLQRAALVLRVLEEESYEEISRALGVSIENVKTHLSRARAKLKPLLEEYTRR